MSLAPKCVVRHEPDGIIVAPPCQKHSLFHYAGSRQVSRMATCAASACCIAATASLRFARKWKTGIPTAWRAVSRNPSQPWRTPRSWPASSGSTTCQKCCPGESPKKDHAEAATHRRPPGLPHHTSWPAPTFKGARGIHGAASDDVLRAMPVAAAPSSAYYLRTYEQRPGRQCPRRRFRRILRTTYPIRIAAASPSSALMGTPRPHGRVSLSLSRCFPSRP